MAQIGVEMIRNIKWHMRKYKNMLLVEINIQIRN